MAAYHEDGASPRSPNDRPRRRAPPEVDVDGEIRALFQRYRDTRDAQVREQLILHYAPLIKYVAGRLAVGMPSSIDQEDLISNGVFGLVDAIERFDPDKGLKFETYAVTRIRGAIIDELRSIDWVPRSVRAKARALDTAVQKLEARLHRNPSDDELAAELGWTLDELQDVLRRVAMTSIAALDDPLGEGMGLTILDTLQDLNVELPEDSVEHAGMREMLRAAISRLTDREQTVLGLYYVEGMTLAQVGEVLGLTESRISQIHSKAVLALRDNLRAAGAR